MLQRRAQTRLAVHRLTISPCTLASSRFPSPRYPAPASTRQHTITRQLAPWRRRRSISNLNPHRERWLATAVDDFQMGGNVFNQLSSSNLSAYPPPSPLRSSPFRSLDQHPPLTLPEPSVPTPSRKLNKHGIPGDLDDMLSIFGACVRVGKFDRAAQVLKRLRITGAASPEQHISLHNQYLRAQIRHILTTSDRAQAEDLHKWYELQIRSESLPNTPETIACMLKASILAERGPRLDRLVRRYMGMVPGEEGLRVLAMADILSDSDLAVITEICPTYNFAADPETLEDEDLLADDFADEEFSKESNLDSIQPNLPAQSVADLTPTPQRGEGLNALKAGMRMMQQLQDVDISKLPESERHNIQLQLERDSISAAIEKWRHVHKDLQKLGINTALNSCPREAHSMSQTIAIWMVEMEKRIKEEFALTGVSEAKEKKGEMDLARCLYGPLIREGDPARLAAVTILSALNLGAKDVMHKGHTVSILVGKLGRMVQEDIQAQHKERARREVNRRRRINYTPGSLQAAAASKKAKEAEPSAPQPKVIDDSAETAKHMDKAFRKPWTLLMRSHVGSGLLKILIDTAQVVTTMEHPTTKETVSQSQPAFTHRWIHRRGKKIGHIIPNAALVTKMASEPPGDYLAKHLPMVVPPKPWTRFDEGAFLDSKTALVRVKPGDVEQKLYTKAAIKRGDLDQVFKGLDILGQTPWKINKEVLGVMLEAWNSGEAIANMPALYPDLKTPSEPSSSADPMTRHLWEKAVKAIENKRGALHSQRCFMNLQLEIARDFRNQTIYFPHNIDYRGRAYPMPTYLNHMGADHTRGLLKFGTGKQLGARGLRWLKIHLANVFGLDKANFDDREAFTNEHMADVIESATNPLKGKRWWLEGEDPWQCLSACFELKAAHELDDPTKFVSSLPVHQDGTCNGLQHYAALGGDTWGAQQVNLEPGDKPADVYSAVADLVKQGMAKDLEDDNPFAKALDGKITRKVVKQTVMTNVYGVTFGGAKKQVQKQLDALYPTLGQQCGFSTQLLSIYIAKHIFTSLASMFRGAHDIQYWLGEVGGRVCKAMTTSQLQQLAESYVYEQSKAPEKKVTASAKASFDEILQHFRSTIVWTTPLRLPVVQPYRKSSSKEVRTCLQTLNYTSGDQTDPVNRRKQLQAFPPNFIHSLDACHMLLSALECHELGLSFAAVHDSFWTHAGDLDTMNDVLRDAFIHIHEEDVVGRLAKEFEARHKGSLYLANIDSTSPVATKIKELRRNSQLSPKEELLLEHRRNTLRSSGNPWDIEAAKKIITPASVYEEMEASEHDVETAEDMRKVALGEIGDNDYVPVDGAAAKEIMKAHKKQDNERGAEAEQVLQAEQMLGEEDDAGEDGVTAAAKLAENIRDDIKLSPFEAKFLKHGTRKRTQKLAPLQIWLPLTIPAIPKKGDFDVSRLRNSKYFFS